MYEQRPWLKHYHDVPAVIDIPRKSLYEALMHSISQHPDRIAWNFFGKTQTYAEFAQTIQNCADGLADLGLEAGDRITLAMPTCPQGIIAFYAINCLGAVANIIHPQTSTEEIQYYLNISQSRIAITLDIYLPEFTAASKQSPLKKIIIAEISDYLPFPKKLKRNLTPRFKQIPTKSEKQVIKWASLFDPNHPRCIPVPANTDTLAAILYREEATSSPKGVLLSNRNLIAAGMNISNWGSFSKNDSILAALPLFHSFGLCACAIATFLSSAKSILVPEVNAKKIVQLIRRQKPTIIMGLPNLFRILTQSYKFKRTDLNFLKGAFCGADTLPLIIKNHFEKIVGNTGNNIMIQEGYSITESVSAVIGQPTKIYRQGSIGLPFPNTLAKIVRPGTDQEIECGCRGELCLSGPTTMLGYLNQPEKTAYSLKKHADGMIWLHTEDFCSMDADGFFYYHLRLNRIIHASGLTISPIKVEDRLMRHPDVLESCVIRVPDLSLVKKIKAFVVLKEAQKASSDMVQILVEHCRKELCQENCPLEIEFCPEIPKTLLGKIAYRELVEKEIKKYRGGEESSNESHHWRH